MQLLNRGMNMKNNRKNKINPKYVLAALSLLCIAGIGLSLFRGFSIPAAGTIVNSLMITSSIVVRQIAIMISILLVLFFLSLLYAILLIVFI